MVRARRVLEELKANGVTHVVGLPDNSSAALLGLLQEDKVVRYVPVTREGEAFAVAAGLWIGGRAPVVVVQNTGLFESGDSIRGTVMRMRIPLVCLITYRGYRNMTGFPLPGDPAAPDAEVLSRAHLDSAALITEPTLRAWGVPYDFLHGEGDLPVIARAFRDAAAGDRPYALLITGDLTGD